MGTIDVQEAMEQLGRLFTSLAHDDAVKELIKMYPNDYNQLLERYKALYVSKSASAVTKKSNK